VDEVTEMIAAAETAAEKARGYVIVTGVLNLVVKKARLGRPKYPPEELTRLAKLTISTIKEPMFCGWPAVQRRNRSSARPPGQPRQAR
jgi:hypothetical protein